MRLEGALQTKLLKSLGLHKLSVFVAYAFCYAIFYLYPNLYPVWEPQFLPMLGLDRIAPFLPWTFLVYTSDYFLILTVILFTTRDEFNSFARMAFLVLIFCGVFFYLLPTIYPRPPYPEVDNPLVALAMYIVASADTPINCFPSQHVALTSICAWSFRRRGPVLYVTYWVWAVAIFASTLTTKQHYFFDILGGLVVAACVVSIERVLFEKRLFYALVSKVSTK